MMESESGDDFLFSILPEPILHQILWCLPAKDAARVSVLSKSAYHLWKSLPSRDFYLKEHIPSECLSNELTDEARNQKLVSIVDHALHQRLHSSQKVIFQNFKFNLILSNDEFVSQSQINRWMELVTRNPIKNFSFSVVNRHHLLYYLVDHMFKLPPSVLALNSFTSLDLFRCRIPKALIDHDLNFSCLKELRFRSVNIRTVSLQKFVDSCPVLETFYFSWARRRVNRLHILKCPLLRSFHLDRPMNNLKLQSPSLESIKCTSVSEFDKSVLRNLKRLSIYAHYIDNETIGQVIRDCPFLEDLDFCSMSRSLKVSSQSLQRLCMYDPSSGPLAIEIVASNLCFLEVSTFVIPSVFSVTSTGLQETRVVIRTPETGTNTSWFCELRSYLSKFQTCKLTTVFSLTSFQSRFQYEELSGYKLPPLPIMGTMEFRWEYQVPFNDNPNLSSLLQGLLWSCRPKTLCSSISERCDEIFTKFVFDTLMSRDECGECCGGNEIGCEEYGECCGGNGIGCWKDVDAFCNGSPIKELPSGTRHVDIKFNIKWTVNMEKKRKSRSVILDYAISTLSRIGLFVAIWGKHIIHYPH